MDHQEVGLILQIRTGSLLGEAIRSSLFEIHGRLMERVYGTGLPEFCSVSLIDKKKPRTLRSFQSAKKAAEELQVRSPDFYAVALAGSDSSTDVMVEVGCSENTAMGVTTLSARARSANHHELVAEFSDIFIEYGPKLFAIAGSLTFPGDEVLPVCSLPFSKRVSDLVGHGMILDDETVLKLGGPDLVSSGCAHVANFVVGSKEFSMLLFPPSFTTEQLAIKFAALSS